jgi:hypothetical protein
MVASALLPEHNQPGVRQVRRSQLLAAVREAIGKAASTQRSCRAHDSSQAQGSLAPFHADHVEAHLEKPSLV